MALTYKQLRQRIAAAVEAVDGWRESKFAFEQFGIDADSFAEQAFAVGLDASEADSAEPQKGRRLDRGVRVATTVEVIYARKLRPLDPVVATDEALDADDELRKAVMGVDRTGLHIRWQRTARQLSPDRKWRIHTLTFLAQHRVDLE